MSQRWRVLGALCVASVCLWPQVGLGFTYQEKRVSYLSQFKPTKPVIEHCIEQGNEAPYCFLEIVEDDKLTLLVAGDKLERLFGTPWDPRATIDEIIAAPESAYFDVRAGYSAGGFLYEVPAPGKTTSSLWITAWGQPADNLRASGHDGASVMYVYSQTRNSWAMGGLSRRCLDGIIAGGIEGGMTGAALGASGFAAGPEIGVVTTILGAGIGAVAGALKGRAENCYDESGNNIQGDTVSDNAGDQTSDDSETTPDEPTDSSGSETPPEEDPTTTMPNPEDMGGEATSEAAGLLGIAPPNHEPNGGVEGLVNPGSVLGGTVRFRIVLPQPNRLGSQILFDEPIGSIDLPGGSIANPTQPPGPGTGGSLPGTLPDPPKP